MKISTIVYFSACTIHGATMSAFNHSFDALYWLTLALIAMPWFATQFEK